MTAAIVGACATILAALFAPVSNGFRPVLDPGSLNLSVENSVLDHHDGISGEDISVVNTLITIKNITPRRLVFIGSTYNIQGYQSTSRLFESEAQWPFASELAPNGWTGQFEQPNHDRAIEVAFDFLRPGDFMEPGQEVRLNYQTPVPTTQYSAVTSRVTVATAYADRLRLGAQILAASNDPVTTESPSTSRWIIDPTGCIAQLTRGNEIVEANYRMSGALSPDAVNQGFEGLTLDTRIGESEEQLNEEEQLNATGGGAQDVEQRQYVQQVDDFYGTYYSHGFSTTNLSPKPSTVTRELG
jgi:hypothetical protein